MQKEIKTDLPTIEEIELATTIAISNAEESDKNENINNLADWKWVVFKPALRIFKPFKMQNGYLSTLLSIGSRATTVISFVK